ncbi:MAG: DMT family transporter [Anaerostipes sp.]|nr:DMT family transporter [Anaerostipes sp.]MDD4370589.1 DMT family transporter [Anaerostipes sp.]
MKKQMKLQHVLLAVLATFFWGSAYPSIKIGYELFHISGKDIGSKLLFAGARFTIAGVLLLLFFKVAREVTKTKTVIFKKEDMGHLFLLGLIQTTIQYIFFYLGLANTTGAKGAIMNSFTAFFPIIIAPFFFKKDRLTIQKIAGCVIGLIGIVVINFNGDSLAGFRLTGEGFVLIAAMTQGIASIYSKKLAEGIHVVLIAGYQLLLGGIMLLGIGVVTGGNLSFSMSGIGLLLYMALISSVAFSVWNYLLLNNSVSAVSIYNLLIPVFGTILSGIFLKENIFTISHAAAIFCVCVGIWIVNKNK